MTAEKTSRTGIVLAALAAAMAVSALVSIRYGALDFSWREMASSTAALLSGRSGWACFFLVAFGVFALYEAARGWCLLRACGIKTKL